MKTPLTSRALIATACLPLLLLSAAPSPATVAVKTEQLNPADPHWAFKTIPRPSKSDIATGARVRIVGNQFEPAAAGGDVLVNGVLPGDSLDLSEAALLSNANADPGTVLIDLGRVQPVAAVASYSWHEWDVDQGSRAPQVYTLYASAAPDPDPATLSAWTRIAEVDTRPNSAGAKWNGQHGAAVTGTAGPLGQFRYLLFVLQRTRSPLQPNAGLTGTLFSEIDVHTSATLPQAGDAVVSRPAQIDHLWVVFKTHLDIGYTERIDTVLKQYRVDMMDAALKVVEASRDLPPSQRFAWTLAGWPLTHVLGPEQDPDRRARIAQAVRSGAIAFHALPFTTHTETQDLEDLVRGLGFSTRLAVQFGRPLPIGAKMTDVPSHSWVLPTLLAHAGVRFLQLGCNDVGAYVHVPPLFWWEGPDGSRILCNYTRVYGSGLVPPRNWPSRNYLAMTMTYDNQGPPSAADVDRLRQQAARDLPGAQLHFGTLDDFARAVLAENPKLPVVRADMPDTWTHGWLSMPIEARAARQFRALEPALDTLDTHLRSWGVPTGPLAPALAEAYEFSELFTEHTFGPFAPNGGSWNSGTPRYLYGHAWQTAYDRGAYRKYGEAFDDKRQFARHAERIVARELSQRLEALAQSVKARGPRVVIYNALPWERSGLVEVPGQPGKLLYAHRVPPNGYKTFTPADLPSASGKLLPAGTTLDTPLFRVTFDLQRGGIASLVEKSSRRQLVDLSSPYAIGQFLHERFDQEHMLAFHRSYGRGQYSWPKGDLPPGTTYAALTPPSWKLQMHHGPAADLATLTATDTLGLARGISLTFTFPRRLPYVEIEWRVDHKTPDPLPEGGWLCFPFAVSDPRFTLGRLGGAVDPSTDIVTGANRHYFCLNSGLTLTAPNGAGIGLCPLDSPCVSLGEPGLWKFSLDYTPAKSAVFINLYNNKWNTNFPEWQDGSWSSRVRFWPVAHGLALPETLTAPSWEARLPLLAAAADGHAGALPKKQAGLTLSRPGVLVTAFGQNPDGAGTLLRLWEQGGVGGPITVALPQGFKARQARPINLRGEPTANPVPIRNGTFSCQLPAFAPASFSLE